MYDAKKIEELSIVFKNFKAMDFSLADLPDITLQDLLQISLAYQNKPVGWRASWVLETIVLKEKSFLEKIVNDLVAHIDRQKDWSSLRSYTKILMEITDIKSINLPLSAQQKEKIIEHTFTWMIDPACALAVRCNCMDILYNLSQKNDWIQQELVQYIHLFLKTPTPAVSSRGKKILHRIGRSQ